MEVLQDKKGFWHILFLDKGGEKIDIGSKLSDFQIIKELGHGCFGSVSLVKSNKTNKLYAMKKIKYEKQETLKEVLKEIKFMENNHHPHVITYFTSFRDNDFLYIITEYINGGSLLDLIKEKQREKIFLDENQVWDLLTQSLSGLMYLHNVKKIIHRDIKPDNLLLDGYGNLKITDFGVSANGRHQHVDQSGPIQWMSPEIAMGKSYNTQSDIYMLGLTFFYLTSYQYYESKTEYDNKIIIIPNKEAKMSDVYSDELKNLILRLLIVNPAARPTAYEAYEEAFSNYTYKYFKTTFIGAFITCLSSVSFFRQNITNDNIKELIKKNENNNNFEITKNFIEVFNSLKNWKFNADFANKQLLKFRIITLSGRERFNSIGEVNADIFTDYLLTKLHLELNRKPVKYARRPKDIDFTNWQVVIQEEVNKFKENYNSIISDNFCYLSKTENECEKCQTIIKYSAALQFKAEFFPDRASAYVGKHDIDVLDLFEHYSKKRLYVDEKIYCKNCHAVVNKVYKTKYFFTFPNTFIMILTYNDPNSVHLFINEKIELNDFVERTDVSKKNFSLIGVVFEKFEFDYHKNYYSIIKLPNGNWTLYNGNSFRNSSVEEINICEIGKVPKVLFYSFA